MVTWSLKLEFKICIMPSRKVEVDKKSAPTQVTFGGVWKWDTQLKGVKDGEIKGALRY